MSRPNRGAYLVERILPSGSVVWLARWFDRGKKRERSLGQGSRTEAEGWLEEIREELGASKTGRRNPATYPVGHALANYAREHLQDKPSAMTASYNIEALTPFFGSLSVGEITPHLCRQYGKSRVGIAPATIARELSVLSAAFHHEVKEGRLAFAPFVPLPARPPAPERWLTRKEAASLLRAARRDPQARGHLPRFILIALYTGARKEAILSLRWKQLNLRLGRLNFNPPDHIETKKQRPHIALPRVLLMFLRLWAKAAKSKYVVAIGTERVGSIKKSFRTACRIAKLKKVTPHTLRHTRGTWLHQKGVSRDQIGDYLGQKDARTVRRYAHAHPDYMADVLAAIDGRK